MDEIIKSLLSKIELSSQRMAQEAQNISLSITAIFGYCAGRESGVKCWLQQNHTPTPPPHKKSKSN